MPYFADLQGPRRATKNKLHNLSDIVMIVLCAVLSGIEDWGGMEDFAEEKEAWFQGFLALPNGIPSHDTLSDVLGRLTPKAFADAFQRWVSAAIPDLLSKLDIQGALISIDAMGARKRLPKPSYPGKPITFWC